jgi:hypothetical protein
MSCHSHKINLEFVQSLNYNESVILVDFETNFCHLCGEDDDIEPNPEIFTDVNGCKYVMCNLCLEHYRMLYHEYFTLMTSDEMWSLIDSSKGRGTMENYLGLINRFKTRYEDQIFASIRFSWINACISLGKLELN